MTQRDFPLGLEKSLTLGRRGRCLPISGSPTAAGACGSRSLAVSLSHAPRPLQCSKRNERGWSGVTADQGPSRPPVTMASLVVARRLASAMTGPRMNACFVRWSRRGQGEKEAVNKNNSNLNSKNWKIWRIKAVNLVCCVVFKLPGDSPDFRLNHQIFLRSIFDDSRWRW